MCDVFVCCVCVTNYAKTTTHGQVLSTFVISGIVYFKCEEGTCNSVVRSGSRILGKVGKRGGGGGGGGSNTYFTSGVGTRKGRDLTAGGCFVPASYLH